MLQPVVRLRPIPTSTRPLPVLPITILGIDLSISCSGLALYKDGEIHLSTLTPGSKMRGGHRLVVLRDKLKNYLSLHEVDAFGLEGYSYGSTSKAHTIGEWGGVARTVLVDYNKPCILASPKSVKSFITGNGNAGKPDIRLHLLKRYGITADQEDEADAACVSIITGAKLCPHLFGLSPSQIETLSGISFMP